MKPNKDKVEAKFPDKKKPNPGLRKMNLLANYKKAVKKTYK